MCECASSPMTLCVQRQGSIEAESAGVVARAQGAGGGDEEVFCWVTASVNVQLTSPRSTRSGEPKVIFTEHLLRGGPCTGLSPCPEASSQSGTSLSHGDR